MTERAAGTPLPSTARAGRASVTEDAWLAGWADLLGRPAPESRQSRNLARGGAVASILALVLYLAWRLLATLPPGGADRSAALVLLAFEAAPLLVLVGRAAAVWSIDAEAPDPVTEVPPGLRPVVLITTRDEPEQVLSATVAAACRLRPVHQTWVLDDGARPWVAEMCARYGARHVPRHGEPGDWSGAVNHALALIEQQPVESPDRLDVIAVLAADHVPLPTFLSATLGWFADPRTAVVQAPQSFYNAGAFDDDGDTGEQGMLFHVLLPAEQHDGAGPYWFGSTALLRVRALTEIGGVVRAADAEETATTVALHRSGWRTRYHHQTLAVGMAPQTPDAYLQEQRRRALGSVRLMVADRLWWPGRWSSWLAYRQYLNTTAGWLAGAAVLLGFVIPAGVLLSGAATSTASPVTLGLAFSVMFGVRLGAAKLVYRGRLHWRTKLVLGVFRILVGLECVWWLLTRRAPRATAAGAPETGRVLGRVPSLLWVLLGLALAVLLYAVVGLHEEVPWHSSAESVVPPGLWLVVAAAVLVLTVRRIRDPAYATTRRVAYRVPVHAPVRVNGMWGELVDVSVGGVAVRLPPGVLPDSGAVQLRLPATAELSLQIVRVAAADGLDEVSFRVTPGDWASFRELGLWLFHTPPGVIDGLPLGAPAVAAVDSGARSRRPALVCEHVDPLAVSGSFSGSTR